ncbi:hypothetical protein AVEN_201359-1 [Araneus ventricosus]|uniref:Uncharacterized protein n=1 Tax=Araneus ventricosus TaxID=182803 RepID=A0A4Y2KGP9_ARAVE|nr:hypothetical protein AVEN_201359-1 [Araneus ventricosus]
MRLDGRIRHSGFRHISSAAMVGVSGTNSVQLPTWSQLHFVVRSCQVQPSAQAPSFSLSGSWSWLEETQWCRRCKAAYTILTHRTAITPKTVIFSLESVLGQCRLQHISLH